MNHVRHPLDSLTQLMPALMKTLASTRHLVRLRRRPRRRENRPVMLGTPTNVHVSNMGFSCTSKRRTILGTLSTSFTPKSVATVLKRANTKGAALVQLVLTLVHPAGKHILVCSARHRLRISPLAHTGLICMPRNGALFDKAVHSGLLVNSPRTSRRRL